MIILQITHVRERGGALAGLLVAGGRGSRNDPLVDSREDDALTITNTAKTVKTYLKQSNLIVCRVKSR